MKIRTFFYTLKQGFVNLFHNGWYSLASVATISACLFMFGVFYAVMANFQHVLDSFQKDVSLTVFFEEGIADERVEQIGRMIENREEVADIKFISADEAWKEYQEEFFKDRAEEFLEGYPTNPLADMFNYEVYLNDVSKQGDMVAFIESIPGVRLVRYSQITADTFSNAMVLTSYVSMGISGLLLAVSIFLISNTVMVGINVRKEEISIMKYIGATDFFVRAPFVLEGIIIGLVGAVIPLFVIYEMYNRVLTYTMTQFTNLSELFDFLSLQTIFEFLIPISLLLGVGIGFVGSMGTVRKHLHV